MSEFLYFDFSKASRQQENLPKLLARLVEEVRAQSDRAEGGERKQDGPPPAQPSDVAAEGQQDKAEGGGSDQVSPVQQRREQKEAPRSSEGALGGGAAVDEGEVAVQMQSESKQEEWAAVAPRARSTTQLLQAMSPDRLALTLAKVSHCLGYLQRIHASTHRIPLTHSPTHSLPRLERRWPPRVRRL